LDMKEDGYFFILDMSAEAMKRSEELTKGLAERYKNSREVIRRVGEQEDSAIEGFGNILG
jgi:hypothetical protein